MRGIRSTIIGVYTNYNLCMEEKFHSAWERSWNLHRKDKALAVSEGQVWVCHDSDAKKDVSVIRKRQIRVTEGQIEWGLGGNVSALIEHKSLEREPGPDY